MDLILTCRLKGVKHKALAAGLGISQQQFSNMLHGFQKSVPSAAIDDYNDFINKCLKQIK